MGHDLGLVRHLNPIEQAIDDHDGKNNGSKRCPGQISPVQVAVETPVISFPCKQIRIVVEFEVPAKAKVLRRKLKNLNFPREAIVGSVARGKELFVPTGEFQFEEGAKRSVAWYREQGWL